MMVGCTAMSGNIFDILADQRIASALTRGEFDNLPGAGRPLVFADDLFTTPEQRMANHVLKNAGFTPREVLVRKEIARLRKEIAARAEHDEERQHLRRRLGALLVQLAHTH